MRRVRVAINGLGRIGRAFVKVAVAKPEIELVAVNDLGDPANLAYLLRYDSAYGQSGLNVAAGEGGLTVNDQKIKFLQIKDPATLPWRDLGVDVVVESTGVFESYAKAKAHLDAGAHKVVVSAPLKDEPLPGIAGATVLMGVNQHKLSTCQISSNASCTTNAASPVVSVLHEKIGIEKAVLNTVHAYTASQKIVDGPDAKDWRRGRAAAANLAPSTTGAAVAVTQAITDLNGKFDGISIRVPVIAGSIADITFIAKRNTSVEEVNKILSEVAREERWQGLLAVTNEPLVSSDIVGNENASIVDLALTKVVGGNLVKVLAWYDNEMGYAHTLVRHVIAAGQSVL